MHWLASDATAQTLTGAIYGTPRYIAPEQIQRRNVGASADRYSLACVIYEMLSGAQPFRDGDPSLLLHQHLHTAPDPITESAPHLPNACDAVFARALAKSPEQRFESARAMIAALEAALGWKAKTQPAPQPVASRFQTVGAIAFGLAGVALIGGLVRSALPSFAAPRAAANLVNASTVIATATPDITPVPPAATVTPVASPTADAFAPNPYFIWGLGMTWHSGQNTLYGAFRPVSNAKPGAQFPIVNSVGSVVANRLLVSVDQAGTVYAYDWESGAKRWQVALQRDVVLAPSITGGDLSLVLIIDSDGELHALQLETGERAWAKNSTDYGPINGIVVGESGTDLYATTRTGHLIAMDDSGLVQWTLTPEALGIPQISSQPTRIEDLVVFNSAEKAIAVSLSKRQRAWAVSNQDALVLNPIVVAPTRVIVTDIRRRVIVIDAVLGAPAFVFQANQELAGIASDWGRVVAVGRDGEITAWNLLEGKQLWSIQLDRNVSSRPLIVATTRDNSIEDVNVDANAACQRIAWREPAGRGQ
jgi:outer membrane protein assembly factor BamB